MISSSSRGGGDEAATEQGGSSMASSVFNLVNNVAGAGILTLAAGMAKGTGWIPAILTCVVLGVISCHTFCMIGESCEITGESDFKGLWGRTIGEKSTFIVDSMIAIMCVAVSCIYSGILGDVFTPLLAKAGLPASVNTRTSNILVLTAVVLFPLSLIKDLSGLAFTSTLGFGAIAYTVLFMAVRSLDGTYSIVGDQGRFLQDAGTIVPPSFAKSSWWNFDFSSLVLASNLGLAYVAHYNGPVFYRSLQNTSAARFRSMVTKAFSILTLLYIVTTIAGYATFGDVVVGNILLNYHPDDFLSTLASLATGLSILFGFPLIVTGAREGALGVARSLGLFDVKEDDTVGHVLLVTFILALATTVSILVKDVSLVVGLTGALMGSFIVYICPAIIYVRIMLEQYGADSAEYRSARRNYALVPFGIAVGGLGAFMTMKEAGLF